MRMCDKRRRRYNNNNNLIRILFLHQEPIARPQRFFFPSQSSQLLLVQLFSRATQSCPLIQSLGLDSHRGHGQLKRIILGTSLDDFQRGERPNFAPIVAGFPLPKAGPWPVAQLSQSVRRSNVIVDMVRVGDATHYSHTVLTNRHFLFGRQLDDNRIVQIPNQKDRITR
uniref:Uncharacterized protein n=1 Tax=Cacopsylla melanoneura TaxID=428564 RepID=A0A8D8ULE4_9HEMI